MVHQETGLVHRDGLALGGAGLCVHHGRPQGADITPVEQGAGRGLRLQGLGLRAQSLGLGVQGLGFRVQGLGFRLQGLGFRVQRARVAIME
jgi:hypothetical protein